jgi:hypothetical protein
MHNVCNESKPEISRAPSPAGAAGQNPLLECLLSSAKHKYLRTAAPLRKQVRVAALACCNLPFWDDMNFAGVRTLSEAVPTGDS